MAWMANRPDAIFVAAAKVGGILANDTYPADFLYDNLVIDRESDLTPRIVSMSIAAVLSGPRCIYPRLAPQPIPEDALLTGPLEPTNEPYAIAKIAGIKLCQAYRRQYGRDFISAMPTNLYGPGDNFDLSTSHVLPALIRKAHEAKLKGYARVDDLGQRDAAARIPACRRLRRRAGVPAADLFRRRTISMSVRARMSPSANCTETVARVVGFPGRIVTDPSKPDGTPRKLMSGERLAALGWRPLIGLEAGVRETFRWYLSQLVEA